MILPPFATLSIGALLISGAAALGYSTGYNHRDSRCDADEAKAQLAATQQALAEANAAIASANIRQANSDNARDQANEEIQRTKAAMATLRADGKRLRDTISSANASTREAATANPSYPIDDGAIVARDLLGECAGEYEKVAGDAGQLSAQLRGLQSWVRGVCSEPVAEGHRDDK